MPNLNDFTQKIDGKFAADEEQILAHQLILNRQHEVRTTRLAIYTKKAGQVMDTIIRPRVEKLVSYFENASFSSKDASGSHVICEFETRPRFPATITVDFFVAPDTDINVIDITFSLQILPVFITFEKRDAFSISLDDQDETPLTQWVESKLLYFLDTYLQLAHNEQYQKQNLVYDPVCGAQVNKAFAISESGQDSKMYYFCTEDCRAKFISEAIQFGPPRPLKGGAELLDIGLVKHSSSFAHNATPSPTSH